MAGSHSAWCGKLDLITYFSVAYLQQMMPWVCMDQCQLWHKPTCWPALPLLLLHTAYYDAQSKSYMHAASAPKGAIPLHMGQLLGLLLLLY